MLKIVSKGIEVKGHFIDKVLFFQTEQDFFKLSAYFC